MNNDISIAVGLFITPMIEILKAVKMPKKYALYVLIVLGAGAGALVSWGQAPFDILLSSVKAAGSSSLAYQVYKRVKP